MIRRNARNDLRALPSTDDLVWSLRPKGVKTIPASPELAIQAVYMLDNGFHKDPMDQFITATAIDQHCQLANQDLAIKAWAEVHGKPQLAPLR
ncbi:MAG: hypothetical protein F4129_04200 [Acidimicrobiia bacterium]|nr:hypothetical protein [Acidimicrobiia bacterium]MYG57051.1 hypothetical protein [Acidimicrobiia bacterium]MYH95695.1 hypothetical protein [Acidimicrobiia bacterium]